MFLFIPDVLTGEEISDARAAMEAAEFADGRETAGWHARLVKSNEQARRNSGRIEEVSNAIAKKLWGTPLFQAWARPRAVSTLIMSRYKPGMNYGSHVDDAVMNGLRTDVSFTIFLADPSTYDGGSLVVHTAAGEQDVKLEPGSLFAYPSTTLHRVEEVTRGERLAAVGWAQSYVRDPARRELLYDLETARRQLFEATGKTPEFDLLSKSCANLLRMWADD